SLARASTSCTSNAFGPLMCLERFLSFLPVCLLCLPVSWTGSLSSSGRWVFSAIGCLLKRSALEQRYPPPSSCSGRLQGLHSRHKKTRRRRELTPDLDTANGRLTPER